MTNSAVRYYVVPTDNLTVPCKEEGLTFEEAENALAVGEAEGYLMKNLLVIKGTVVPFRIRIET